MNMWKSVSSMEPDPPSTVSGEDNPLLLNFQNHYLLCLQHEDPAVLRQIVNENPKGLVDFQPIMSYLTGTVNTFEKQGKDDEGGIGTTQGQGQYYPLTKNLPPLCKLCYDILAELYLFHCELMELQRKIQNQTEAARRIVRGTMRKRGGMRAEFFNRLKIAGVPKEDVQGMELFVSNFHELILEADQKAVLTQMIPPSTQISETMQPYHVEFVEPVASNSNAHPLPSPPIEISAPFLVQIAQPEAIDEVINEQLDSTVPTSSLSSLDDRIVLVDEPDPEVAYEYEGDEEETEGHHDKLREDVDEEEDVVILDDEDEGKPDKPPAEVIDVLDEEHYETIESNDGSNEVEEEEYESDEEMDLEYWKNMLSSSLIMEQVEEEEDSEQGIEENSEVIQVVHDDDQYQRDNSRNNVSSMQSVTSQPITLAVTSQYSRTAPSGEVPHSPILSCSSVQKRLPSTTSIRRISSRTRYQCRHCDKSYQALQRLRYHEQVHLPGGRPKPFLCGECQKRFSTRKLLEQHERVHTGERPFACEICGSRFRQSSTLYRHRMAHKRQELLTSILGTPSRKSRMSHPS